MTQVNWKIGLLVALAVSPAFGFRPPTQDNPALPRQGQPSYQPQVPRTRPTGQIPRTPPAKRPEVPPVPRDTDGEIHPPSIPLHNFGNLLDVDLFGDTPVEKRAKARQLGVTEQQMKSFERFEKYLFEAITQSGRPMVPDTDDRIEIAAKLAQSPVTLEQFNRIFRIHYQAKDRRTGRFENQGTGALDKTLRHFKIN